MFGEATNNELPPVLREPMERNVQLLLNSRIPARLAWTDGAGEPWVTPLWFRWTGSDLELSTFAGTRKLGDLHDGDVVAVSIDTETFPYRSLRIRGPVTIEQVTGLTDAYRDAARRYLGSRPAQDWCERLNDVDQALLRVRPVTATASHMWDAAFLREQPTSP